MNEKCRRVEFSESAATFPPRAAQLECGGSTGEPLGLVAASAVLLPLRPSRYSPERAPERVLLARATPSGVLRASVRLLGRPRPRILLSSTILSGSVGRRRRSRRREDDDGGTAHTVYVWQWPLARCCPSEPDRTRSPPVPPVPSRRAGRHEQHIGGA